MIEGLKAASAYGRQLQSQVGTFSPASPTPIDGQAFAKAQFTGGQAGGVGGLDGFSSLLQNQVVQTVQANRSAEQLSLSAVRGNADLTSVVEAVNQAESSLRTVVAIRDKMVSAYQQILRMPI